MFMSEDKHTYLKRFCFFYAYEQFVKQGTNLDICIKFLMNNFAYLNFGNLLKSIDQ